MLPFVHDPQKQQAVLSTSQYPNEAGHEYKPNQHFQRRDMWQVALMKFTTAVIPILGHIETKMSY